MKLASYQHWLRKDWAVACLFLAPSIIGFTLFYLLPFLMSLLYSLMDGTVNGQFVGMYNYQELLASDSFKKATMNTFTFSLVSVPLILSLSLGVALLLNQPLFLRQWLRTAYVMPLVVPVASTVLMWQILFDWNGTMNGLRELLGYERIDWMKSEAARYVVVLVYVWKNLGYNVLLFLAGLQQIPKDYYETAQIEGAGGWTQFRITLIYLTPMMFFVTLMSLIHSFKVFRETYLIAGDYPHDSIYFLQHYMNNRFVSLDIPKLTAAASLMAGGMLMLVFVLFTIERKHRQYMEQ